VKVKVCGITTYRDAVLALDLGADALGFNFYPGSPRYVDPQSARAIIQKLPPFGVFVGLFVNADTPAFVAEVARAAGVQVLQLHGDETPEYCRALSDWILIKALRIGDKPIETSAGEYPVQALLLDARDEALYGGTGKSFDWNLAREIGMTRPLILAGGLRAENVAAAIRMVRPYAVDVCSGVESRPGTKDAARLAEFMNEVRNVSASTS
jgi:phosphoribosylanthranilate isomerase